MWGQENENRLVLLADLLAADVTMDPEDAAARKAEETVSDE